MKYDLHTHSYYSDGQFSPEELIELALSRDLSGIAITDHDNIDAIEVGKNYIKEKDISFDLIPGIEFGTSYKDEEIHILGYYIDYEDENIIHALDKLKYWREERTKKIVDKLNAIDIKIDIKDVENQSNKGFTGRVPIAKALVEYNYVESIGEAFDKYLALNKIAYERKDNFTCKEIISLIKESGGVAILAHPILLKRKETLDYIKDLGIDGIECYHSKQSLLDSNFFKSYARFYDLLISGGSDCHGRKEDNNDLLIGKYFTLEKDLERIKELHYDRKYKNK